MGIQITVGRGADKHKIPIEQAETADVEWWATNANVANIREGAIAELKRRGVAAPGASKDAGSSGKRPAAAAAPAPSTSTSTAITKAAPSVPVVLAIHNAAEVTQRLLEAGKDFHLVSPATSVDVLPEGFGVALSVVHIDPTVDRGETKGPGDVTEIGGKLMLSANALKRIAAAAAIDWDPQRSGRLDDGSDSHYCHFRAVGTVRNFDGSKRTITGEVEIDARDGSPQIEEIIEKAKNAKDYKTRKPCPRDPRPQILELRKFLLRHAETKAKNRAIVDMGLKRTYTHAELKKPFAVARVVWTGQSSDPELRREFARMGAERMLDGTASLYGHQQAPALQPCTRPAASLPQWHGHSPPPIGTVTDDPDDPGGFDLDREGETVPAEQPATPAASPAPASATPETPAAAGPSGEDFPT